MLFRFKYIQQHSVIIQIQRFTTLGFQLAYVNINFERHMSIQSERHREELVCLWVPWYIFCHTTTMTSCSPATATEATNKSKMEYFL